MDRETAKEKIKTGVSCTEFLEKSQGGLYCCPFPDCNSGHGENKTGAVKYYKDTNKFYCHACQRGGDVITLYQQTTGADYNEAVSLLAQRIGITVDPYRVPTSGDPAGNGAEAPQKPQTGAESTGREEAPAAEETAQEAAETANYSAYYRECRKRLNDPAAVAYLQGRGISMDTAAAYWMGFDPAADPASAPGAMGNEYKPHPCPRIIIPTSTGHYVGRSIDPKTPKGYAKMNPNRDKGAAAPAIFNARVLYAQDVQEVFVTEGAFDALSVIEAGAAAIALNSAANAGLLIKQLEQRRTGATLILCLDNDERGQKETTTIREGLQRLNIPFICADICAGHKDPNEALTADREAFVAAVEQAKRQTAARPDNTSYYIDSLMTAEIERFRTDKNTGFAELDRNAGGLYSGLYVLAAISSLGKTSFALQLADQLAAFKNEVLFFSLEQSRLELVSKSLARITAQTDPNTAVTSLQIRKGYLPEQVKKAAETYKKSVSDRLSIIEGNFACTVSYIVEYVRNHVKRTGTRPVVIIDYLQILQPADDVKRQTTKETVDTTVTELKRLSRELDLTVILISSVNRTNYLTPIDFESLKESGGIEFTADVIWGLQLQCLNEDIFDKQNNVKQRRDRIREEKSKNPRRIELVCLKNRYGISSYSVYFDYFPANDLFKETREAAAGFTGKQQKAGRKL